MIRPAISLFCVRALNCLQNSMMLICAWPRAGPTGGAGVALPASICSFTDVCTFFGAIDFQPDLYKFSKNSIAKNARIAKKVYSVQTVCTTAFQFGFFGNYQFWQFPTQPSLPVRTPTPPEW